MKKIILGALMMVFAISASAQLVTSTRVVEYKQPHNFTWGPKVGVDYTHFWGKGATHDGQLNYQIGLFLEYGITSRFAIAPEVVFAAQGGKFKEEGNVMGASYKFTGTYNTNYINVPVMLKFYVIPQLSIDFGPQLGINVYSKYSWEEETKYDGGKDSDKDTDDLKDATKTIDVGVGLGLTYNITKDVFVQGRYTMGLTKVFDTGEAKNGNAQIAIGYRF